jgi:hypothetical protein
LGLRDEAEMKWEYRVERIDLSQLESCLNELGLSNWEAISFDWSYPIGGVFVVLKRER